MSDQEDTAMAEDMDVDMKHERDEKDEKEEEREGEELPEQLGGGDADAPLPLPPGVSLNAVIMAHRRMGTRAMVRLTRGTFTHENYQFLLSQQSGLDTVPSRALSEAYRRSGNDAFTLESRVKNLPRGAEITTPRSETFYFIRPRSSGGVKAVTSTTYRQP